MGKKKKIKIGKIDQLGLIKSTSGKISRNEQRSFVHNSEKDYTRKTRKKAKEKCKNWEESENDGRTRHWHGLIKSIDVNGRWK